jgi:hypothetical protein
MGTEPFKVVLPHLSEHVGQEFWVKVRFLRGRDVMDFLGSNSPLQQKRARSKKRLNRQEAADHIKNRGANVDETLERNINRIIVEAMGVTDRRKIKKLVDRMHSSDIAVLLDFLTENTPGIDNSIETECGNPQCDAILNVPLPITDEFFRPKKSKRARE